MKDNEKTSPESTSDNSEIKKINNLQKTKVYLKKYGATKINVLVALVMWGSLFNLVIKNNESIELYKKAKKINPELFKKIENNKEELNNTKKHFFHELDSLKGELSKIVDSLKLSEKN